MFGNFRRDCDFQERCDDVVSPENLHDLQGANHHSHQHSWKVQNLKHDVIEHFWIHGDLIQGLDRCVDSAIWEQKDSASNPSGDHHYILKYQEIVVNDFVISVCSRNDEEEIAHIVNQENKDSNHPEVHHVREEDEEHRKRVMKSILVKVTLWSDEYVLEKATEMFAELDSIINLHTQGSFVEWLDIFDAVSAVAISAQECGHKACW